MIQCNFKDSTLFGFLSIIVGLVLVILWCPPPQLSAQTPQIFDLHLNEPVEREIRKGEAHKYRLTLKRGEFIQVHVKQEGIDVVLSIRSSDGKQLAEMDTPNGTEGFEVLSFFASTGGNYVVNVQPFQREHSDLPFTFASDPIEDEETPTSGKYEISLRAKRPAKPLDFKRIKAERELLKLFRSKGVSDYDSVERIHAEIVRYERSADVWRDLKDEYIVSLLNKSIEGLRELMPLKEAKAKQELDEVLVKAERDGKRKTADERFRKKGDGVSPQLIVPRGHTAGVDSVVFSPDGRTIASGAGFGEDKPSDSVIKLWDTATGSELKTFAGHLGEITSVAFSPDGKTLASGSWDKTVRLWNVASGQEIKALTSHSDFVWSVAFSPDGRTLASSGRDKTIRFWDVAKQIELIPLKVRTTSDIDTIAFSPDGKSLAAGSGDTVTLWDVGTWRQSKTFRIKGDMIYSIAFSPDGKTIASGNGASFHGVRLWDVKTGRNFRNFEGFEFEVKSVAFSPNGEVLAGGTMNEVRLWNLKTKKQIKAISGETHFVNSVVFSPEGSMLAYGSNNQTVQLWDLATQRNLRTLAGHAGGIRAFAFSADARRLAMSINDGTTRLWNLDTGQGLTSLIRAHDDDFSSVAFSPDGRYLAFGRNKFIKVWDFTSSESITLTAYDWEVTLLAFSSDNRTLASVSGIGDTGVTLWDVVTAQKLRRIDAKGDAISAVAFSSDGKTIALGSYDSTVSLWDVTTGDFRQRLRYNVLPRSIMFSPDGKTLAVSCRTRGEDNGGNVVRLWDLPSGREINYRSLPDWTKTIVENAITTPNGKVLRADEEDNRLVFRDVSTEEEVVSLIALEARDWAVVDPYGRWDASTGAQDLMYYVLSTPDGYETVALSQLKARYYEPNLLPRLLGYNKEPLRDVSKFESPKLYPIIKYHEPLKGGSTLTVDLVNRGGGLGRVQVFVNGTEFLADARDETLRRDPLRPQATLNIDLSSAPSAISGGDNNVHIVVWNVEDYISSRGIDFVWNSPGAADKSPPEVYAIIGGVSKYAGTRLNLRFPARDATAIANAVELGAKRLFGADKVHLTLLSSSINDPRAILPTKENFAKAFNAARSAKPTDILIIYLAGHGISLQRGSDIYCYLTQEAWTTDPAVLSDVAILKQEVITSEELVEWIKGIPANKRVIMLDTCAAGAAESQFRIMDPREASGDAIRAIERARQRTGSYILMGSAADAAAYETSQYNQGLLTYALLRGMKGEALRDDEFINVDKLFQYARDEVEKLATKNGGIQRPTIFARKDSFEVGQLKMEDKEKIFVASPRPIVLRPFFFETQAGYDSLALMKAVRARLRDERDDDHVGQSEEVFSVFDDDDYPGGITPTGSYSIEGNNVTMILRLRRNGVEIATTQIFGKKDNVSGLAASVVEAIKSLIAGLSLVSADLPESGLGRESYLPGEVFKTFPMSRAFKLNIESQDWHTAT